MAHASTAPETISRVSVDPAEMESFARMAENWWDPSGPFKPLHIMNGARLGFIKETLCAHFLRDPDADLPLKGLRILDIGCGGGLLCEPMTRLGAEVTGVDALEKNLKTAKTHAAQVGLDIDYRHGTIEQMVQAKEKPFDAVLNMEVIEHVAGPPEFMADCGAMGRGGGLMICSTINRTMKAFLFAIVGAEYVLRWLPKGTHQYDKLVKPVQIRRWLIDAGLEPQPSIGMSLNPVTSQWRFTDDLAINYVTVATKPAV
jgi:2-polyprenyl-6-hydroxyphenyl methylase/3-demethylubiquinone-9 3-methyltransferase